MRIPLLRRALWLALLLSCAPEALGAREPTAWVSTVKGDLRILIESPTLWVGMGQLVRDTSPLVAMPKRVFIGFGGKESPDSAGTGKMIGLVRMVESNFHAAGYDAKTFRVVVDASAQHTEAAWEQRLPGALTFLFGD